jgi:hypothetical protein
VNQDFLGDRKKALIDEFFHVEEAKKLENLKSALARQKSREALRQAAFVQDDTVLDRMIELGLTAETITAIALAPLVHVAWADGELQPGERDAILAAAHAKGIERDAPAGQFLASWLSGGEPERLFPVWSNYVQSLCERLEPAQRASLKKEVTDFARAVAEAAGGFLGLGRVSGAEERALAEIAAVFGS